MAFKLGDVIVDRLQFGYGARANGTPICNGFSCCVV